MDFESYKIKKKICKYVLLTLLAAGLFIVILQVFELWSISTDESTHNTVLKTCESENKNNKNEPKIPLYSPIKVLVVADSSMSLYHGENLRNYLYLLFKLAAAEYRDESLGHSLQLEANHFITLGEEATNLLTQDTNTNKNPSIRKTTSSRSTVEAENLMKNFCKWQNLLKLRTQLDYNVAVYMTKLALVDSVDIGDNSTEFQQGFLGMANEIGVACEPSKSCAVVHDFNLETSSTIAHEIGHLLGMHNDESEECQDFKRSETVDNDNTKEGKFIMGYAWHSLHVFGSKWSKCSRFSLDHFLKSNESHCIYTRNDTSTKKKYKSNSEDEPLSTEGEKNYDSRDPDELCNFFMSPYYASGLNISHTSVHASKCPGILKCSQVSCLQGPNLGCVTFLNLGWSDRTSCGREKNESEPFTVDSQHWCMKGNCVYKTGNLNSAK